MDNEKEVSIKFSNEISNEKALKEYEQRLQNIYGMLGAMKDGRKNAIQPMTKETKNLKKETDNTTKAINKMGKQFSLAFNTSALMNFTKATYSLFKTMLKMGSASSAYIENINLLEVAYAKITDQTEDYNKAVKESSKAVKEYIDKMSKVYGFDESRLTRSFGIFKQMANAMKLPSETAEELSEHLVKMSNDIASLYNIDLSRAENALQSALSGQVRPIRSATGADITEKTLQGTVDSLGLDRSISDLSYVEKRLVMIISLTEQLKKSQGDYGRTVNSVSNQIRIMHEQWNRVTRAVGDIFYPILKKILPVLNAILMVTVEIAEAIAKFVASLLHVNLDEQFDYSNLSGMTDATQDLIDGMDDASDSADNLKQKLSGLRGFDKLNVISTPKDSSASSGSGSGGIDPSILDAFNEAFKSYDDMLDSVKNKAVEIKEQMMEWLALPLDKKLKSIYDWFMKLSTPMKIIVGLGLATVLLDIFKVLSKIAKLTGVSDVFMGIAKGGELLAGSQTLVTIGLIAGAIALISYSLWDLYNTDEEFRAEWDEMWLGVQEALVPVFEHLQELGDNLMKLFNETLKPMFKEFYDIIQTTAKVLLEILYPVFKDFIIPVIGEVIQIVNDVIEIINKLWKEYGEPISKLIQETIETIGDIFNNLWNTILKPIIDNLMKRIDDLWKTTLKPMFEKVGNAIGKIIELVLLIWNKVLAPLINWFINTFGPAIASGINLVVDIFHTAFKIIGGIINGILDVFNGILDFIIGIFTGDLDKALSGITGVFRGVINVIITLFEGLANVVIDVINFIIRTVWNGIKKLWNKLAGFVEGVADVLGLDINVSLKGDAFQLTKMTFPRLEAGIDFVPKDYYGPVYLDYGERVLTRQENKDYSMNNRDNGFNYNNSSSQSQPMNATFIVQVGNREIARQVITDLQDMAKSNGRPITIGG